MAFQIALYKGEGNLFNKFVRYWDRGQYSHCELIFSDGLSVSASFRDGYKVRGKVIPHDDSHWDYVDLPDALEANARVFYEKTNGVSYDLFGQLRFILAPVKIKTKGFWCSEWIAEALGLPEPWRYSPNSLASALALIERK